MKYCPKCFKNLDKDYKSCPICGYEDKTYSSAMTQQEEEYELFTGSVFDILDDMDAVFNNEKENKPYGNTTPKNFDNHICQNDILEAEEKLGEHICHDEMLEAKKKLDNHICQNDILEVEEKFDIDVNASNLKINDKRTEIKQNYNNLTNSSDIAKRLMEKNNQIDVKALIEQNKYKAKNNNYNPNYHKTTSTVTINNRKLSPADANKINIADIIMFLCTFFNPFMGIIYLAACAKRPKALKLILVAISISILLFITPFFLIFIHQ